VSPPILRTRRLVLRALSVDDAAALHPMYADVDANHWGSYPPHTTLQETRDRLANSVTDAHWRAWAVTLKGDDTAIGTVACYEKRQGKVSEIGYSLCRPQWGQGIAREAVIALVDLLFAEGQRRVFADTDPDNVASIALVEGLGFVREARLRAEWETHIGVRDSLIFGMLADEWRARRAAQPRVVSATPPRSAARSQAVRR
jgi:RimJ/RimL family protein N-acetyltransferase